MLNLPTSHTYISQRLRLHYCAWGDTDKPVMLLVHGMQDHCRTWDWLVEAFVDEFHIIAPDLRGHGDSAWAPGASYAHPDYVYDLTQLMRQIGDRPVTLLGHSLGGTLACLYAGTWPGAVSRLICIEGVGLWPGRAAELTTAELLAEWMEGTHALSAREPRRYPTLGDATARMQKMNPNLTPEQAAHLTGHGTHQNEDGSWSWKFDNYTHNWPPFGVPADATTALWNNITCPTLLLNADEGFDHRIGQNGTHEHFRQLEMHTVANAGHWTYHDQLSTVVRLTRDFLQRHPESSAADSP